MKIGATGILTAIFLGLAGWLLVEVNALGKDLAVTKAEVIIERKHVSERLDTVIKKLDAIEGKLP